MKRLLQTILCVLFLSFSMPAQADELGVAPSAPREDARAIAGPTFTAQVSGTSVNLSWTPVSGAVGYVLYYVPAPYNTADIRMLDCGAATSLPTLTLWEGADFRAAVAAYDYYQFTDISNIVSICVSSCTPTTPTTSTDLWDVQGSTVNTPATVTGKTAADQYLAYVGGSYITAFSAVNGTDYNTTWDQEVQTQKTFWGTPNVEVYRVADQANNPIAVSFMNDVILIGDYLFSMIVSNNGETAIHGILAHEIAHQLQFYSSHNLRAFPLSELEADAFSGYYLAIKLQSQWSEDPAVQQQMQSSILGYFQMLVSVGSYNFTEQDFHGTPEQRLSAGYMGMMAALQAMQQMAQTGSGGYTTAQLQQIFTQEINTNIVPNPYTVAYARTRQYRESDPAVDAALMAIENSDVAAIARGETTGRNIPYPQLSKEQLEQLEPGRQ